LTLRVGDQTLYAKITQSFIQVDSNIILYIDGGSSYDLKANSSTQYNYQWGVEGFPTIVLPNTRVLTLNPT